MRPCDFRPGNSYKEQDARAAAEAADGEGGEGADRGAGLFVDASQNKTLDEKIADLKARKEKGEKLKKEEQKSYEQE